MSKPNGEMSQAKMPHVQGTSLELPMLELPTAHPCSACGKCCHYIAIEIDNPSSFKDYDELYWYLTHRAVCVYIDWEGDWFIEFETVCEHLTETHTCGVYEERPRICSDFSWNECEVTTKENAWKTRFDTYEDLTQWMQEKRPRAWENYVKMRGKLMAKRNTNRRTVLRKSKREAERAQTGL